MLRMFGTGLKVSRSFLYHRFLSSHIPLKNPWSKQLVGSFPKFSSIVPSQTSIIALAVARNGLPRINGSVGSSSISSTMKSVGSLHSLSQRQVFKHPSCLFATDKGMRLTDDPRSQRLFLKDRVPTCRQSETPRIFLFVGDDLPLNDCTALTSQHYHPLCFPGSLLNSILQEFLIRWNEHQGVDERQLQLKCLISSSNLALCASNSCFLNLPGKGRGGLYGGGPAGVSFFFATGLVGWLDLLCLFLLGSIELWFVLLSLGFSARSSSGSGFCSSSIEFGADQHTRLNPPLPRHRCPQRFGVGYSLGNCAHF
ncbi:unnamed protein product [Microthlaspi erraticum]|uniref:Uncharacterized protein n=1 Tax=Microthlaspi erraticum TaxID=1685480 RepID=A0A6D2JVY2_9BRAS|nr:unnamed protein product [Microthlaspi erraticum]